MPLLAAALLLVAACSAPEKSGPPPTPPGHAVATAHPLATRAAIEILDQGGNAFDAAVAVSAALAVVEPYSSGIGGGGFWLLHRESDGMQVVIDGRETAPLAATPEMFLDPKGIADPLASRNGARAAAIPGAPAAWAHIAQQYGSKPLSALLAPAMRYAREGFAADARFVRAASGAGGGARLSPAAAAAFFVDGVPPMQNAVVRQPELAATLERLGRDGRHGFYEGPTADALLAGSRSAGGIWAREDLLRYRVVERKPTQLTFRDYRIITAPPPSAGGVAMAQALAMLEARAWPPANPVQAKHQLIEVMRRAFRDRRLLGDPEFVTMPLVDLTSREYLVQLAAGIDPSAATPSERLPPAGEGDNTTHFSILDAAGNRVAGTLSVNTEFGSGYMAPGTGVLFNNEMDDFAASMTASNAYGLAGSAANAIAPGKRPLSSMSPTFVEGPRGLLILGTPGGSRIITMVLRGVLAFVHGLSPKDVVALPRYHHQYLPDQLEYESGALSAEEQAGLNALGHRLRVVPAGFGNMQVVWWDRAGDGLEAASDPRGVGSAEVKRLRAPVQVGR
ncbi:MAG TPA: gamma-glutamyltransferase [Verrucomicrobiae bacterium]|nr:gamma-glutamyltransferase [Verrucomicrobiae bacterium]